MKKYARIKKTDQAATNYDIICEGNAPDLSVLGCFLLCDITTIFSLYFAISWLEGKINTNVIKGLTHTLIKNNKDVKIYPNKEYTGLEDSNSATCFQSTTEKLLEIINDWIEIKESQPRLKNFTLYQEENDRILIEPLEKHDNSFKRSLQNFFGKIIQKFG